MNQIKQYVDALFAQAEADVRGIGTAYRTNPVDGGGWVPGLDSKAKQKAKAVRALIAREKFNRNKPVDVPSLPLTKADREAMMSTPLGNLQALYARSLEHFEHDYDNHPSFARFAAGVMASPHAPDFIKSDPNLQKRFPARLLPGLGHGCYWSPGRPVA